MSDNQRADHEWPVRRQRPTLHADAAIPPDQFVVHHFAPHWDLVKEGDVREAGDEDRKVYGGSHREIPVQHWGVGPLRDGHGFEQPWQRGSSVGVP